jgi:hypothetical protein
MASQHVIPGHGKHAAMGKQYDSPFRVVLDATKSSIGQWNCGGWPERGTDKARDGDPDQHEGSQLVEGKRLVIDGHADEQL